MKVTVVWVLASLVSVALLGFNSPLVTANFECGNRYVTLVNPVRSRDLWADRDLKHLRDQYGLISSQEMAATWLLQYDTMADGEVVGEVKNFNSFQEIGLFAEVSKKLADRSGVVYPSDTPWYKPNAVFLSGYNQSERRRLIDESFKRFKSQFGYFPKSVGAWWIDSYSLNYMKEKYLVNAVLIVADQRITDNYGVWGAWWGLAYYPSNVNVLVPASDINDKLDIVVIQWAQRHPSLAYGNNSLYSMQANDYVKLGKNVDFFKALVETYLSCENEVGQVTVGLETGMESTGFLQEYSRQLGVLKSLGNLKFLTMSDFYKEYVRVFPRISGSSVISDGNAHWRMTTKSRSNSYLGEYIDYAKAGTFKDYFLADQEGFLDRKLPIAVASTYVPQANWLLLAVLVVTGLLAFRNRLMWLWWASLFYVLAAFGLIMRSGYMYGWQVFYGPPFDRLELVQALIVVLSYAGAWLVWRIFKSIVVVWSIVLVYGLAYIVQSLRASVIEAEYYLGFLVDNASFWAVKFSQPFNLGFINLSVSPQSAKALLKVDVFDVAFWPAFLLVGLILGVVLHKLGRKASIVVCGILAVFFYLYLLGIFNQDPKLVN